MNRHSCLLLLFLVFLIANSNGESQSTSLSLKSAVETGLRNNPEVKAAEEKINAARGRFLSSISPPPASLSGTDDYVPTGTGPGNFGEQTFGINQSFDFPTSYFIRGSRFNRETAVCRQEYEQARIRVSAAIKASYVNVLAIQEQLAIARENLALMQDFQKKAEARFTLGEGSHLERLTAKVQQAEASNKVELRKNELAAAFAELNHAMGNGRGGSIQEYRLADSLAFTPLQVTIDDLLGDAQNSNPSLSASRLRVDLASSEKSLAWSSFLPEINLGIFSKQVKGDATKYYGASLGLSLPLWFMLDQRGRVTEASANLAGAKADLLSAESEITLKTRNAFIQFRNAEKQVVFSQTDLVQQAEENYRVASKSYNAGEVGYLELLQAQQTLIAVKSGYIDALLAYNLSLFSLEQTIGKNLL